MTAVILPIFVPKFLWRNTSNADLPHRSTKNVDWLGVLHWSLLPSHTLHLCLRCMFNVSRVAYTLPHTQTKYPKCLRVWIPKRRHGSFTPAFTVHTHPQHSSPMSVAKIWFLMWVRATVHENRCVAWFRKWMISTKYNRECEDNVDANRVDKRNTFCTISIDYNNVKLTVKFAGGCLRIGRWRWWYQTG